MKKIAEKPEPGDRVKLRGRENYGVLEWVNSRQWCAVSWGFDGPKLCHLRELELCN